MSVGQSFAHGAKLEVIRSLRKKNLNEIPEACGYIPFLGS
jgi:hypothetical protein